MHGSVAGRSEQVLFQKRCQQDLFHSPIMCSCSASSICGTFYHVLCVFVVDFDSLKTQISTLSPSGPACARTRQEGVNFFGRTAGPFLLQPSSSCSSCRVEPSRPLLKPWRARAEPRARRSLIAPPTSPSARRSCRRAQSAPFPRRNNRVVTEVWQVQRASRAITKPPIINLALQPVRAYAHMMMMMN